MPFDEQTTQVFHVGPAACAVPGVVAGMAAVHGRYGRCPGARCCCRPPRRPTGASRPTPASSACSRRSRRSSRACRRAGSCSRRAAGSSRSARSIRQPELAAQHRAAGRARPRRAVHGRPRAGDGRRPGTAGRQADDGRPGRLPPGLAAAAGRVVRGPRAAHQLPAVVGRRADRLHAGGAGRRPPGGRAGVGAGAARAGRDDARRRAAARAGVRPPAAPRRPGRPRAGPGGGRGGPAERRAGARAAARGRRLGDPVRPRHDAHLGR